VLRAGLAAWQNTNDRNGVVKFLYDLNKGCSQIVCWCFCNRTAQRTTHNNGRLNIWNTNKGKNQKRQMLGEYLEVLNCWTQLNFQLMQDFLFKLLISA
jgi:hypothetical protein